MDEAERRRKISWLKNMIEKATALRFWDDVEGWQDELKRLENT